jgi:hypothetical protein
MVCGSPDTPASSTTKTGRHVIAESGVKTPEKKIIFIQQCWKMTFPLIVCPQISILCWKMTSH